MTTTLHTPAHKQFSTLPPHRNRCDFTLEHHGNLWLLDPVSDEAEAWVAEWVWNDSLRWCNKLAVDQHYIDDIINGLQRDGLTVRCL